MWHKTLRPLFFTALVTSMLAVASILTVTSILTVASTLAHADINTDLANLQQQWANTRYQTAGDLRQQQLTVLVKQADNLTQQYNTSADAYLWAGIIRGSLAEAINSMESLSLVKAAKLNLEKSIELNPDTEESYALGVLGLMYAKVPGWPLAFGDNATAAELLSKGIAQHPEGMNINYHYASYLFEQGHYQDALTYINKAQQATPPAPAAMWAGRLLEIAELAAKIQTKINR